MNRTSWLELRQQCITGTDISAILGVNEYKSKIDVWLDKVGRGNEVEENSKMIAGRKLEPFVREWFSDYIGKSITQGEFVKDGVLGGTPDGFIENDKVVEFKTTQIKTDEPLTTWILQAMWYAYLCKMTDKVVIAWVEIPYDFDYDLFNGTLADYTILRSVFKLKYAEVDYDQNIVNHMRDTAYDFWHKYVVTKQSPPAQSAVDVTKLFINPEKDKAQEINYEQLQDFDRYKAVKQEIKTLQSEENSLKDKLYSYLNDATFLSYEGKNIIKRISSERTTFDSKSFKMHHEDLYYEFAKTSTTNQLRMVK